MPETRKLGLSDSLIFLTISSGEEGLAVCGHILLRSGVEIVSRQLKAVRRRKLPDHVADGDHREAVGLCHILKEEILAGAVLTDCC